jgi:hypothetical protein
MAASAQVKDLNKENIAITEADATAQPNGPSNLHPTDNGDIKTSIPCEPTPKAETGSQRNTEEHSGDTKLIEAVKSLSISSPMPPSLVVNGSGLIRSKPDGIDGLSEGSGSDLGGTKPPSLDGKSITSGTTFALDEKESLRPDDSASVKAAEDDDAFSGRGSIVAGSRMGSEAGARAYRAQFYDERRSLHTIGMSERPSQGVLTPQSGSSGQQTTDDGKPKPLVGASGAPEAFNLFYRQTPDEKLLEALDSPKDRIFLLRLEQDVIEFVKSSK